MATRVINVWELIFQMEAAGEVWHNTWQVMDLTASDTPPAATDPIVNHMTTFMENNLSAGAQLVQAELRNVANGTGSLPIGEDTPIWEQPINQPGQRQTAYGTPTDFEAQDIRVVAYVRKVNRGRVGKVFLRDFLVEGDVVASDGGRWQFVTAPGTVTPARFDSQVSATIADYLTAGVSTTYKLAVCHQRKGSTSTLTNTVDGVVLSAASWHRRRH